MAELKTMPPRDSFTPAIATPLRPHLATGQWEGGSSLGWSVLWRVWLQRARVIAFVQ